MNKKQLKKELNELIRMGKQEYEESIVDKNSYGHGYDTGYLAALRDAEQLIVGLSVCKKCNTD